MNVVIVTDIFGCTIPLKALASKISMKGAQVTILDPYMGHTKSFSDEDVAYKAFIEECGLDKYSLSLQNLINEINTPVVILGFSAGASAAWRVSACEFAGKVVHSIGFYPGQIRRHLNITPTYPTTLVFPKYEKHFDLDTAVDALAATPMTHCIRTPYMHGFMNPLSQAYNEAAAKRYETLICDLDNLNAFSAL